MESLKIIVACIVAACFYGVAHDQVTIRICPEYFTIYHPPVFSTHSLTILALGWGILATWWAGAMAGVMLALSARLGARSKLTLPDLLPRIGLLLCIMACSAIFFGVVGYVAVTVPKELYLTLTNSTPKLLPRFSADYWAHGASYASGLLGSIAISIPLLRSRDNLATHP